MLNGPCAREQPTKHLAKKMATLEGALSDFKVALSGRRYGSVPNFAESEVIPMHSEQNPECVHRVLVNVHVSGLLHDRITRVVQIAAHIHNMKGVRTSYHLSVDRVNAT